MKIKIRLIYFFLLLSITLVTITPALVQSTPPQASGGRIGVVRAVGTSLLAVKSGQSGDTLAAGALVFVLGRSADSTLLMVQTEEGATGWVSASALLVVDVVGLPVVDTLRASETSTDSDSLLSSSPLTTTTDDPSTANPVTAKPTTLVKPITVADFSLANDGVISATVQISALNFRGGPGTAYPVVGKTEVGVQWRVVGRNQLGDWVQITAANDGDPVWAAARFLQISAALTSLPIVQNIPAPPVVVQSTPATSQSSGATTATVSTALTAPASPASALGRAGKTGLSGTLVFQESSGGTIYVYDLGGDTLRPLTGGLDPAVSPDGKMVAFARDGGERGIYVINIDGSGERRVYNEQEFVRSPKWSPDGSKIVFSRTNGFEDCRVTSGGHCLPDQAIFDSLPPELELPNMDVEKLVKDLPNYREYFYTLSRIGVDGSGYLDIPAKSAALSPDWGEGGIIYQSHSGIQRTSDAPNAESVEIRDDNVRGYLHDPDVQPGTGRIVFQRKGAGHWQIYLMNGDGSGMGAITRPVTALVDALPSNVSPAWSPDGQTIVYLSNRDSIESAGAWHLWVMNADGSNQRQLPIDVIFDYGFASEQMVSWGK